MSMNRIKILLVDDDEAFLSTYQKILSKNNIEVIAARDGEEAVASAFAQKPDVIILDIDMPKKDGFAVMKDLRADPWGKNVPIIIMTGKEPDDARLEQINQFGVTYYFVKGNQSTESFIATIQTLAKVRTAA